MIRTKRGSGRIDLRDLSGEKPVDMTEQVKGLYTKAIEDTDAYAWSGLPSKDRCDYAWIMSNYVQGLLYRPLAVRFGLI